MQFIYLFFVFFADVKPQEHNIFINKLVDKNGNILKVVYFIIVLAWPCTSKCQII